jgi:hypothetical protein
MEIAQLTSPPATSPLLVNKRVAEPGEDRSSHGASRHDLAIVQLSQRPRRSTTCGHMETTSSIGAESDSVALAERSEEDARDQKGKECQHLEASGWASGFEGRGRLEQDRGEMFRRGLKTRLRCPFRR